MVKKTDKQTRKRRDHVRADVIILGCSLPGIVTAHRLKKKFGDSMEIVVLDLQGGASGGGQGLRATPSRCNVAFKEETKPAEPEVQPEVTSTEPVDIPPPEPLSTINIARYYLTKYAKEFDLPVPDGIINPILLKTPLKKLFEYRNGSIVECNQDYNEFGYLNFVERFELEQYQAALDACVSSLFQVSSIDRDAISERKTLLYYDRTTMEEHICNALLFPTSREIMRTIVRLVCGATAENVSLLFYLHQCYRNHSAKNHIDGDNIRVREKLLGYCRKRLAYNLQQSIEDIILASKPIKEIRTYADEQVILETVIGETDYICNLLAMALRPDELRDIRLENSLVHEKKVEAVRESKGGTTKMFKIKYEENFWQREGYSGDVLSVRGPIIWAIEKPDVTNTGKMEKSSSLVGYVKVIDPNKDTKEAIIEQLVKLFGEDAANPIKYKEKDIKDIFVPRHGDFVALRELTHNDSPRFLEWGALDVFADGDVAAAIEAGHSAYLHLLSCLRPQALTYEDVAPLNWPINLETYYGGVRASVNIISTSRLLVFGIFVVLGVRLVRSYLRSN